MDAHEYGQQPSYPPPSGLPVPPRAEVAPPLPPAQTWAQPPAGAEPSGLPSQGWVQPHASGQPGGLPPATDPADGPTLSAFSAYGRPAASADPGHAAQPYGQTPGFGQPPAAPPSFGLPPATGAPFGQPPAAGTPFGQPPAFGQMSPDGGQEWPPYLVQPPAAPGPYVPRRGPGRTIAAIVVAGVVLLGGACAVAADTWAKGRICDAVQQLSAGFTAGASRRGADNGGDDQAAIPPPEAFDKAEDGLNGQARMLFFHGDLKDATHGLADDIASIKHLTRADLGDADLIEMAAVAISFDGHVRKAQRACGQPEQSVFDRPA